MKKVAKPKDFPAGTNATNATNATSIANLMSTVRITPGTHTHAAHAATDNSTDPDVEEDEWSSPNPAKVTHHYHMGRVWCVNGS